MIEFKNIFFLKRYCTVSFLINRLIALTIYVIYTHQPNIAEVTDRYTLSLSSAVSLLLLLDLIYSFSHNQNCEYALSTLLLIP